MGVDLDLIPVLVDVGQATIWPSTILAMNRRRDLWDLIMERLVPCPFGRQVYWNYEDDDSPRGAQPVTDDPYGVPWTYALVSALAKVLDEWTTVVDPDDWQNRAVAGYIRELNPDVKVILRWH